MIPVFDLTRQNTALKSELFDAINQVIKEGIFILGKKVAEFEAAFAKYLGVQYAVGVASGTDALTLSLLALGIERGDEVIMPANAYPTAFAVTSIGAIPKLVDIDPNTYNIDTALVAQAVTGKTKAIIPVHLYGQPADIEAILEIGKRYKIPIIEDCCQAHGARIVVNLESRTRKTSPYPSPIRRGDLRGEVWKKVGSLGDVGCYSFYPTKNLGCFGDGGMVVTNNPDIYEKVRLLRMYGEKKRYQSVLMGINSRLDELQAAILLVKLKYLGRWNSRRRELAKIYTSPYPSPNRRGDSRGEVFPSESDYVKHVYHLYVIRSKKRELLKDFLAKKGIGSAIHYPTPIHLQPSFKFLGYKYGDFPEAEKACKEVLSLPMYPELSDDEVKRVVNVIEEFFNK